MRRAAYRVVQEALTNAAKHAAGATVAAELRYAADGLTVEVTDTGGVPGSVAGPGGGHGLTGLRARVEAAGGALTAGPASTGGFRVTAHFPIAPY
nr:hypothetical protein GCM10020063_026900 [Dactylosporangium thailandense]